ncbi:MAG: helix-hairpin-helix domain-containing protein [Bacteroidota bacterium]
MAKPEGFSFNSSQKKGIFLLTGIVLLGFLLVVFWPAVESSPESAESFSEQFLPPVESVSPEQDRIDINLADSATWESLPGIGPVLSQRILRYREKTGGFQEVEQLQEVYGLEATVLEALMPRLFVNELTAPPPKVVATRAQPKPVYPSLDLNTATAEELEQLPGIGKILSQRIVKFRSSIRRFNRVEDLQRVYYLSPETYANIKSYLYVRTPYETETLPDQQESLIAEVIPQEESLPAPPSLVPGSLKEDTGLSRGENAAEHNSARLLQKLDLNTATEAELQVLPGIGEKLAPRIIKFRNLLGFYASVDQLKHVYGLSPSLLEKAQPYLEVGNAETFQRKDLNRATARSLAFYPTINKDLAEEIVAFRRELGHFRAWEELTKVLKHEPEALEELKIYFFI